MPRDYKSEYANYQGQPEQIKKRAERVKARRMMEKTSSPCAQAARQQKAT